MNQIKQSNAMHARGTVRSTRKWEQTMHLATKKKNKKQKICVMNEYLRIYSTLPISFIIDLLHLLSISSMKKSSNPNQEMPFDIKQSFDITCVINSRTEVARGWYVKNDPKNECPPCFIAVVTTLAMLPKEESVQHYTSFYISALHNARLRIRTQPKTQVIRETFASLHSLTLEWIYSPFPKMDLAIYHYRFRDLRDL